MLDLEIFPHLSGARNTEDIHPTAVDISSDVATGLADCSELETIILSGRA
jgi:hypothetical protein